MGHLLKPTKARPFPRYFIFFDTETDVVPLGDGRKEQRLKMGVAFFVYRTDDMRLQIVRELVFHTPGELWDWVDKMVTSKQTVYMVAHNITFDLVVTKGFTELAKRGWHSTGFYSKGMTSIFRWRSGNRKLIMLDNGNFYQGSLASLGKMLGFEKLVVDFLTVSYEDLLTYCRRDVEIMVRAWETWLRFLSEHDCGAFKYTVASTAFNTWRHRFMKHRVYISHVPEVVTLEREAYKGGRTEVLWVGHRNGHRYYYVDVNNMYGYVLREFEFPAGLLGWKVNDDLADLERKLERYAVIALVRVNVDDNFFPIKIGEHTVFPVGRFWTVLTTPELRLVFERGWVEAVHAFAYYRKARLFREFVDYFYGLRQRYKEEGNRPFEKIAKLMVNSLYGKFGQRGYKQKRLGDAPPDKIGREEVIDVETGERYDLVYFGGSVFKEWREGESYNSFPAIAAHVTAYARLLLTGLRNKAGKGHVYYMDTDSLIVDDVGLENLREYLDRSRLGGLKIEVEANDLTIYAPKDYKMGDRVRLKGIRKNAIPIGDGVFKQEKWPGFAGLLRQGNVERYIIEEVVKRQRRVIWSGVVSEDGWVVPHVVDLPDLSHLRYVHALEEFVPSLSA